MLVLDLADNLLDQIFDRHQSIDPAELVDHHGNVSTRLAHLDEKVEDQQRRRDAYRRHGRDIEGAFSWVRRLF